VSSQAQSGATATPNRSLPRPNAGSEGPAVSVRLLNGFGLEIAGRRAEIPLSAQRVLAFVALHPYPPTRSHTAGAMWLDLPEERAAGNLRSALWRLRQSGAPLLDATNGTLRLEAGVRVDVHEASALADRWLSAAPSEGDVERASSALEGELLPDWDEDWVNAERERFHQLRLHALEAMADQLSARGHYSDALLAGLSAVIADPLRESAHRAVIKVHLAEGNTGEAVRQIRRCERLMLEELGVPASPRLGEMMPEVQGTNRP